MTSGRGPGESSAGLPRPTLELTTVVLTRTPLRQGFSGSHVLTRCFVLSVPSVKLPSLFALPFLCPVWCFHDGCVGDPSSGRHRQRFRSPQ